MDVLQRFLRYVKVDTPSNPDNDGVIPSSDCQFDLANKLVRELNDMGLSAELDENCYVYASIPANCEGARAIGLIAHMDVVSMPKGYGVNPQVFKAYDGGNIVLPSGAVISPNEFPELKDYVGQDIVTSDGTTILGADDKAGIAEIMTVARYICDHPEFKHGKVGIAFTPDEEIGSGACKFDVKKFGCDFAYTVDGEQIGEISYETFNAASFDIKITGNNIHPGSAKGKMVNAVIIANEFISALPQSERPETTEGREGFYFVSSIEGGVESCNVSGIIRDHDRAVFEARKSLVKGIADKLNGIYGGRITLEIRDQYRNCAEIIKPHYHLVENVANAMKKEGVEPIIFPVRGGTDGSGLSFMGLPCPNICTGGHNAHSVCEYIPVQSMEKVVKILLNTLSLYAQE